MEQPATGKYLKVAWIGVSKEKVQLVPPLATPDILAKVDFLYWYPIWELRASILKYRTWRVILSFFKLYFPVIAFF